MSDSDDVQQEPILTNPPEVYVEPQVPDPFLIDSDASDDEPEPTAPSATANLNKDVPPPPSESEEEDAPEIYLPGLVLPTMFLPIPNTDPITTLLNKYIHPPERRPARDVSGEWQKTNFHTLVMTNSWRALARMARDRIVTADPEDLVLVLGLWYLRLACLSRLRLFNQTSVECTNLFSVLNAVEPPETKSYLFDKMLPFELEVMYTRLKYWAGDHLGYLDALSGLLRKCKIKAKRSPKLDPTASAMWKERGARVSLIIASQLMEMKEFGASTKLLEPLCNQAEPTPSLRSAVARIYLQAGYIQKAHAHFSLVEQDSEASESMKDMNRALLACANGEWENATNILTNLLEREPENFVAVNNLSVSLLSQGKLRQGIETLEKALSASPASVVTAEPFLFNLSTLYELRSATATQKKLDLLIEVAKWSGDGLKASCLKMSGN
ncbi:hypothetical protein GYMLUDRAFT_234560 [Collybiopsis luxurians FD-317 M1]|uniref:Trafficking protein particle complex subunit 12 n=1 Tax=Collybiopsis luxurians FD-317 M1 TaxID=944289 RepID=A0A0D0C785_9AGAR|nr:hypothetical protein GYMLUDRAFT_234560 [Collybiopsis luxurians FD-317 M1]